MDIVTIYNIFEETAWYDGFNYEKKGRNAIHVVQQNYMASGASFGSRDWAERAQEEVKLFCMQV